MLLVLTVAACFGIQLSLIKDTGVGEVFRGYLPSDVITKSEGLYQACGILGATVSPISRELFGSMPGPIKCRIGHVILVPLLIGNWIGDATLVVPWLGGGSESFERLRPEEGFVTRGLGRLHRRGREDWRQDILCPQPSSHQVLPQVYLHRSRRNPLHIRSLR